MQSILSVSRQACTCRFYFEYMRNLGYYIVHNNEHFNKTSEHVSRNQQIKHIIYSNSRNIIIPIDLFEKVLYH
jgi:hypothetical protein